MDRALTASWLLALALLLMGCESNAVPTASPASSSESDQEWEAVVYFTDPEDPQAGSFRGGPDASLAQAIDQAQVSIKAALYDLNLWSIRDALLAAFERGVEVQIVTESDNLDEPEIQELKAAGIPVLGDRREGLMHNKFFIIDGNQVWTGSMNYTTTDGYFNDNHLVQVYSSKLAENYTREFTEMFDADLFGPDVRSDTPFPSFEAAGWRVETYFSPDDGMLARLLELVSDAEASIYFLAFSFTSDSLAEALLERAGAGVTVAGVFEEAQVISNIGSEYERLLSQGLDVRLDGNPRNMHHKVILIDESIVVLGSYNFSNSAETRNDENSLILHDAGLAAQFMQEFERIYLKAHR